VRFRWTRYHRTVVSVIHQPFPMLGRRRAQAWRYQPAFRRPCHFHEESEFNLVAGGWGVFTVGDREIRVEAGDLLWFIPGVEHYLKDASEDFDLFVVGFCPDLLAAFDREHQAAPSFSRPVERVDPAMCARISDLLVDAPESADDLGVERRLLCLLRELSRRPHEEKRKLGHQTATVLLADREARRDDIARKLASNRWDVSRRFNRDHGISLSEFRNRLRTLELIRLLDAGETNLTRGAMDAGFGSYSQCHRVIRALLGTAPRELLNHDFRAALAERFEPLGSGRVDPLVSAR
jgi:AraC-like DNA-binding protein